MTQIIDGAGYTWGDFKKDLKKKTSSELEKELLKLGKIEHVHEKDKKIFLWDSNMINQWKTYDAYKEVCLEKDYKHFNQIINSLENKYSKNN